MSELILSMHLNYNTKDEKRTPTTGSKCFKDLFAYWVIFHRLLIFSKSFKKNSFRNTIRVSYSMVPNQAQHFVGPDLGPNCLQRFETVLLSTHNICFA